MKVLFITHPECDYGGSMAYMGLCQLIGEENVDLFPPKISFHGQTHNYQILGRDPGQTSPLPWQIPTENRSAYVPYSMEDFTSADELDKVTDLCNKGEYDLVFVESTRPIAFHNALMLRRKIGRKVPFVVHDGEDYKEFDPKIRELEPDLVLKRERSIDGPERLKFGHTTVIPFPFSICDKAIKGKLVSIRKAAKIEGQLYRNEVAFMCGDTTGSCGNIRANVAKSLVNSFGSRAFVRINTDSPKEGQDNEGLLNWPDYLKEMESSLCAVTTRGFGWDTVRFWEVPFCTLMMAQRPQIHIPDAPIDMEHCIFFDNEQDLVDRVKWVTQNQDEATQIFINGVHFFSENHTNSARVRYMFETLVELGFKQFEIAKEEK